MDVTILQNHFVPAVLFTVIGCFIWSQTAGSVHGCQRFSLDKREDRFKKKRNVEDDDVWFFAG